MKVRARFVCYLSLMLLATVSRSAEMAADTTPHTLAAAKVIVNDMKENRAFYQQTFGLKELPREGATGKYEEVILGFDTGARLALVSSPKEQALAKSRYPVLLIYTPDFETIVKRL